MLNRSASLAMSTSILKALPGKLDIKRNSPSTCLYPLSAEKKDASEKCCLLKSSAAYICLTLLAYLSIEANSVDPVLSGSTPLLKDAF